MADPFSALADIILGVYKERKVQMWVSLIFQMSFSAFVTFLYICGTTLLASKSWLMSIASGMISAAIVLTVLYRRSSLTKGMIIVLPLNEAKDELNTDIQIITKDK